jgi:hypothetical protein
MIVGGAFVFLGFILLAYSSKSTVKEDDPADWWKNGRNIGVGYEEIDDEEFS